MMKKFTLLELLVVISIIGILLTILIPSLRNAKYSSQLAVCVANLKQTGISYAMYATSNNRRYPAYQHEWFGNILTYKRKRTHIGVKNAVNGGALESLIKQYWNLDPNEDGEAIRQAFTCPLVQNEYDLLHTRTRNDGSTYVRFPYAYTNNLAMAYHTYNNYYPGGSTKKMMEFLGEPYIFTQSGERIESHILGSDINETYYGLDGKIVNHRPLSGNLNFSKVATYGDDGTIPGFLNKANAAGNGWVTLDPYYSANYLMDDGSAKMKKKLNNQNTYSGLPKEMVEVQ
jgi:prepilin-type N-terminal cleavage/methylation domain-containing protein